MFSVGSAFAVGLVEATSAAQAGGKGAGLGELVRAGVRVPPGFIVTTKAFGEAMAALDPVGTQRKRIARLAPDDLAEIGRVTAELRRRIERAPVPEPLSRTVLAWYQHLGTDTVAVRSSATCEDGADASFAGLQDTSLWVRGGQAVLASVRRCWASLYSVESVSYRRRRGLPEHRLAMAVVVQEMVDARCAGVMFTRSPLTGDRSVIVVEGTWGVGDAVVGGEVTPDRFTVNKVTGEVVSRTVASPGGCCLTDGELAALVTVAKRIERHYGAPQDIEWAIAGGAVSVLQSRPETVWARRDATPVVPARASALDHVLDVLGGRAAWG